MDINNIINESVIEKIKNAKINDLFFYKFFLYKNKITLHFSLIKNNSEDEISIIVGDFFSFTKKNYIFEGLIEESKIKYSLIFREKTTNNYYEFEISFSDEDIIFLKSIYNQKVVKKTEKVLKTFSTV